jgi:hypothetical protein
MPAPFGCCPLKASQEDLYAVFMALAKGDLSETVLADWFESKLK